MILSIRLSPEQKSWLEHISDAQGITMSEWVRNMIDQNLETASEFSISELATAEAKALFEMRFLIRLILSKLNANQTETHQMIEQAKLAAAELFQKKLEKINVE